MRISDEDQQKIFDCSVNGIAIEIKIYLSCPGVYLRTVVSFIPSIQNGVYLYCSTEQS